MTALLRCESLTCGYPGRHVLEDVELTVGEGEIVVLLGPNGSGKSTLLKTLGAWLRPISGRVLISGLPAHTMSKADVAKQIAYVPQEEHPAFPFTARQIVMMGRLANSPGLMDTSDDERISEQAMKRADCLVYADRPVTELSGGERQRVLIARSLASEARVLLLDEPSSHLDAAHVVGLIDLLQEVAAQGHAIIVAVHDLNVAAMLGHRALLLGSSQIRQDATVEEVLTGSALEEVYSIGFDRLRDSHGRLRVFPAKVGP
jgi:iron complex transport system ATP-binding protein